jgi:hypothetical protein
VVLELLPHEGLAGEGGVVWRPSSPRLVSARAPDGRLTLSSPPPEKNPNKQDPENKRYVISDDRLKKLFGEDRFLAFGIQRLISPHVIKGDASAGGGASGEGGGGTSEEEEAMEEGMEEEVKAEEDGGVKAEGAAAAE